MLSTDRVFQAYVGSVIVLGLNLLVLANNTAVTRALASEVVNPEDRRTLPTAEVVYEGGNDRTGRYRRAHRNALENILLFLVTGYLLALTSPAAMIAIGLYTVFVAARLLHSVTYVLGLQPWRTASFVVGALTQVVILFFLGYQVFWA